MPRRNLALMTSAAALALGLALVLVGSAFGAGPTAPTTNPAHPASPPPATQPAHDPPKTVAPAPHTGHAVDDVLDVLHQANPELEERIREAMKGNPDRVKDLVRAAAGKLQPILDKKHSDPPLYQLLVQEYRCTTLMEQQAAAARAATDPLQAQKARDQVRMLLHQRFAVRQEMAELDIKRQVAELEKALDARAKDEDKLVDNELNRMLPPPPPPKPAPPK